MLAPVLGTYTQAQNVKHDGMQLPVSTRAKLEVQNRKLPSNPSLRKQLLASWRLKVVFQVVQQKISFCGVARQSSQLASAKMLRIGL